MLVSVFLFPLYIVDRVDRVKRAGRSYASIFLLIFLRIKHPYLVMHIHASNGNPGVPPILTSKNTLNHNLHGLILRLII